MADRVRLASPSMPFPIDDGRYRVSAAVRVLGRPTADGHVERGHFRLDAQTPAYLAEKVRVLRLGQGRSRAFDTMTDTDRDAVAAVLETITARVADEYPGWVRRTPDGVHAPRLGLTLRWTPDGGCDVAFEAPGAANRLDGDVHPGAEIAGWLAGVDGLARRLDAVALLVPEDLVVVRGATDERPDALEALHVCFASSWSPQDKVGRDFSAVHAPVVDNAPLLRAHTGLVRLICSARPHVRYAWGLHRDDGLCHDPRIAPQPPEPEAPTPDEAADGTVFRVERQTTFGVPSLGRGVFTIRVYRQALRSWATDPRQCALLADALAGMTPAQLTYKGLTHRRDPLVRWLRDRAGALDAERTPGTGA